MSRTAQPDAARNGRGAEAGDTADLTVPRAAQGYIERGWSVHRVAHKAKAGDPTWDTDDPGPDDAAAYFRGRTNIGVKLSKASGGLTDVDLDCPEAVALAPHFLPKTGTVFGRKGSPSSHWLYRTELWQTAETITLPFKDPTGKGVLLEIRTGKADGTPANTVVPPSVHESGERVEWVTFTEPAHIDGDELRARVTRLYVATLLLRHWPEKGAGARHGTAFVVGSYLASRGFGSADEIAELVGAVAEATGDDREVGDRRRAAKNAAEGYEPDKPAPGFPTLLKHFGKEVAEAIEEAVGRGSRFPDVTKDGKRVATVPNGKVALQELGIACRFDLFKGAPVISGDLISEFAGRLQDPAIFRMCTLVHDNFRFYLRPPSMQEVVWSLAQEDRFHPVRDYLDGLTWDGVERLDRWLIEYGGAEDTEYVRAVSVLPLIAAVRRVRQPGCKFDEMLVLESEQGTGKSQTLEALVPDPDWFSDSLDLSNTGREAIEQIEGYWVLEVSELKGLRRAEVTKVKAFLSRTTDRGRKAYGHEPAHIPRQCVFIGTTNDEGYLSDRTGNRRYWPVRVQRFDLDALHADRDQLWAEAAAREAAGESIRLPEALWPVAAAEQAERQVENAFLGVLERELGDLEGKITRASCWEIVGTPPERRQWLVPELEDAMRQLGWQKPDNKQGKLRFGSGKHSLPQKCFVRGEPPYPTINARREQGFLTLKHGDGDAPEY